MRFLYCYCRFPVALDDACDKARFHGSLRGFPNLIRLTALVCKRLLACGAACAARSAEVLDASSCWPLALVSFSLSVGYPMACDQL
jgi:hypothetical protein